MKISLKNIIGILGIAIAIIWSVQGVNFEELVVILGDISVVLTLIVLVLTTLNLVIRAIEWKFIVHPIKPVPLKDAFASYLIGVFSNQFLPFKLGDVAQGYSLGRKQDISKVSVFSAVLIQRLFEVVSLFVLMGIVGIVFSFPLLFDKRTILLGVIILIGVGILFVLFKKRVAIVSIIEKWGGKLSPNFASSMSLLFEKFMIGTQAIFRIPDIMRIMTLAFLSWFIQIVMVKYTAESLGIELDIISSSVVLLIVNMGLAIPIAPGNLGTFQFFSIIALSLFAVSKSKALAFSIIFQVIQGLPVIIGGGISVFAETIQTRKNNLKELREKKKNVLSNGDVRL